MVIRPVHDKLPLLLVLFLMLSLPGTALAEQEKAAVPERKGGLKTNYSKISVANLPIGQTISMTKIANAPMLVGNNYDAPAFIMVRTEVPAKPKDGYSPIPDPAWVVIEPNGITLQANASTLLDVKVILPNDEKLFGKKYVCNIVINTEGDPGIKAVRLGASITGLFMFSIAPGRNEEGLKEVLQNPADAAYEIVPPVVVMEGVKPGQKIKIRTEAKKKLELINHSKQKQQYWLHSVDPRDTKYTLIPNSRFGGNVDDVILRQERIKLGPGRKKALDITIQVPLDADFKEASLAYLVAINSGAQEGVIRYLAIYLNGKKEALSEEKEPL